METAIPGKILIFGEWGVLRGGTGVGIPLNTNFELRATLKTPDGLLQKRELFNGNESTLEPVNLLDHDSWAQRVESALQKEFFIPAYTAWSFRHWQLNEGLGSSSALFLALLEWREREHGRKLPWDELLKLFRSVEGNRGSGMDLAIQRLRAPLRYADFQPHPLPDFRWPPNLFLLHGNRKADTAQRLQTIDPSSSQAEALSRCTQNFLDSNFETRAWISAIQTHRDILSEMNVVPPEAFALYESFYRGGLIQELKSVGAGGMDGLLVWCRSPEDFEKILPTAKSLGWYPSPHRPLRDSSAL